MDLMALIVPHPHTRWIPIPTLSLPLFWMVSQLDLSYNQLCGIDDDGEGQYNAEGITAIADAMRMRVDGALTEIK